MVKVKELATRGEFSYVFEVIGLIEDPIYALVSPSNSGVTFSEYPDAFYKFGYFTESNNSLSIKELKKLRSIIEEGWKSDEKILL